MGKLAKEQMAVVEPKLRKVKCPVCGSHNLIFNDIPTQVVSFSNTEKDIDFSKVSFINCVSGECLSCGYILQFRLDTLLK